jgi:hypothetical protein
MPSTIISRPEQRKKRTLEAGQSKLRAAARARIEAKRRTSNVERLFQIADDPANRIRIGAEALEDILSSFPGDPD